MSKEEVRSDEKFINSLKKFKVEVLHKLIEVSFDEELINSLAKLSLALEEVENKLIEKSKKASVPDSGQSSMATTANASAQNSSGISSKVEKQITNTKSTNKSATTSEQDSGQTSGATTSEQGSGQTSGATTSEQDSGQTSGATTSEQGSGQTSGATTSEQDSGQTSGATTSEQDSGQTSGATTSEQDNGQTSGATSSNESVQIISQLDDIISERNERWEINGIAKKIADVKKESYLFYTGARGYHISLWANFKKHDLSLQFQLVEGEFDNENIDLRWPFKYDVTLSLLNKNGDIGHQNERKYDKHTKSYDRPSSTHKPLGPTKFIELDKLQKIDPNDEGKSLVFDDKLIIEFSMKKSSIQ